MKKYYLKQIANPEYITTLQNPSGAHNSLCF